MKDRASELELISLNEMESICKKANMLGIEPIGTIKELAKIRIGEYVKNVLDRDIPYRVPIYNNYAESSSKVNYDMTVNNKDYKVSRIVNFWYYLDYGSPMSKRISKDRFVEVIRIKQRGRDSIRLSDGSGAMSERTTIMGENGGIQLSYTYNVGIRQSMGVTDSVSILDCRVLKISDMIPDIEAEIQKAKKKLNYEINIKIDSVDIKMNVGYIGVGQLI